MNYALRLQLIRGNLALLRRNPPISASDHHDVLNDLDEETDRLIRLVNNLLVLARADVQSPQWQDPIQLQPLLETVERQITQLAPDRHVCFESNSNGYGGSVMLKGNQDALKQVLLILLDNAIKHTPSTTQIYVQSMICQSHVEIHVRDTGPGIPQDHLERIFERFYVVDDARTHNSTGLGLAIARTLVESQNGKISVESTANIGTTFKIMLPCQPIATMIV